MHTQFVHSLQNRMIVWNCDHVRNIWVLLPISIYSVWKKIRKSDKNINYYENYHTLFLSRLREFPTTSWGTGWKKYSINTEFTYFNVKLFLNWPVSIGRDVLHHEMSLLKQRSHLSSFNRAGWMQKLILSLCLQLSFALQLGISFLSTALSSSRYLGSWLRNKNIFTNSYSNKTWNQKLFK